MISSSMAKKTIKEPLLNNTERALLSDILATSATHVRFEERTDRFAFFNTKGTQTALSAILCPNIPRNGEYLIQDLFKMEKQHE